ncbi:hypothetical protein N0V93_007038 [Gnomoniopsis smithogilvyi]|uniref:Chalcone isomerase domain-containing protein n=1 Tax=Gnomoniopsis smithogilvyi TaxID=1191159 RepID=A0A9W8YQS9_9PEZI|nr:hypothetical protein N0V93_007038 [Gnomoniopsis smithogilvyi]
MLRRPVARLARPILSQPTAICPRCTVRTFLSRSRRSSRTDSLDSLNISRLQRQHNEYYSTRQQMLAAGAAAGVISIVYCCYQIYLVLQEENGKKEASSTASTPRRGTQLDSSLPVGDPLHDAGRKVVMHDEDGHEVVQTGNSTVPLFPRTIELPDFGSANSKGAGEDTDQPSVTSPTLILPPSATGDTEYTLVGLGTRSVSFLGINVYVLGYYIATADVAELQARLVKKINPIASTLVSTEKDDLRKKLLDVDESEKIWQELLQAGIPARSLVRVVPVRDTDFPHLRDGFMRAIQARTADEKDEEFGEAMREFKRIFTRGKVPKQKELLMLRDRQGRLTMVFDDGKSKGRQLLGTVDDERISRALWMNYLGGKRVASEEAKKNIVNGVMEFVERPVGTVAAQVV